MASLVHFGLFMSMGGGLSWRFFLLVDSCCVLALVFGTLALGGGAFLAGFGGLFLLPFFLSMI